MSGRATIGIGYERQGYNMSILESIGGTIDLISSLGRVKNPALAFRFSVEVDGISDGVFSECSGLSITRNVEKFFVGGINHYQEQLPGQIEYQNITLKQGVFPAASGMWKWFSKNMDKSSFNVERKNITVILYGFSTTPYVPYTIERWEVEDAFPVKWDISGFKSDSNEIVIETLEIAHRGFNLSITPKRSEIDITQVSRIPEGTGFSLS
ncbi:MAG: hypothetical protein B6242_03300 [Anaerolineaceae bacterium 4572_78]|nr:MAG: hypothetical protein B6242_03300 [Anaerolineaceae bacterium 4572_78]